MWDRLAKGDFAALSQLVHKRRATGPPVRYHLAMLSQETLAEYRRMTPGQRLGFSFALIRENTPYLLRGPEEVVNRRFELLQRENDLRNEGILRGMARMRPTAETAAR